MGQVVFFLLTLLLPLAAAYIHHRISTSAIWDRRRKLSAERERWDREECLRQFAHDRLAEQKGLLQAKLNDIERRRDALRAKRRALEQRAQALAQQRLIDLERERRDGVRFATDLHATLVQTDYDYVQAALRRKKYHLLGGQPWDRAHGHRLALVPLGHSNGRPFDRSPD
jgi:hypothetical protein